MTPVLSQRAQWRREEGTRECWTKRGIYWNFFGYCQNTTTRGSGTSPFIVNSPGDIWFGIETEREVCQCGFQRGDRVSTPGVISPATYDLWHSQRGDWVSTPRLHLPCHIRRLLAFLEGRRVTIPRRVQPKYHLNKLLNLNKLSIVGQFY